jgi:hypothetical protein
VGTRTRGFVDYRQRDDVDRSPDAMLRILETTTPACQAVEEYWRDNDTYYEPGRFLAWAVWEKGESDELKDHWWFAGPGHMSIRFCPNVAEIFAGARWRGFLTIPPLREVHRAAFLSIARAVGASGIIFVPDYADELIDAAEEGKGFEECLKLIELKWGPMQGDLDEIRPAVVTDCASCPPKVWFLQPT